MIIVYGKFYVTERIPKGMTAGIPVPKKSENSSEEITDKSFQGFSKICHNNFKENFI